MSDSLEALIKHQTVTISRQYEELSAAVKEMAVSMGEMAKTVAVSEQKHSQVYDEIKELKTQVRHHDERIRTVEANDLQQNNQHQSISKFWWMVISACVSGFGVLIGAAITKLV